SLLHSLYGGDDETVGLGVPQQGDGAAQSAQRLDQANFQVKAVATKRIIFFTKSEKRVGCDFTPPVPRDVRDGRWATGTLMVGVGCRDCAPRTLEALRDGRWLLASRWSGARARCSRAFRSTEGRPSSARRTRRRKFT